MAKQKDTTKGSASIATHSVVRFNADKDNNLPARTILLTSNPAIVLDGFETQAEAGAYLLAQEAITVAARTADVSREMTDAEMSTAIGKVTVTFKPRNLNIVSASVWLAEQTEAGLDFIPSLSDEQQDALVRMSNPGAIITE